MCKHLTILALGLILIAILAKPIEAKAPEPSKPPTIALEGLSVPELVEYYSKEYNVSQSKTMQIAFAESGFNEKAVGDLKLICPKNGKPVRARGVYQITECYHPEINDTQAFDKVFNVEWGVRQIAENNCKKEFSTCR